MIIDTQKQIQTITKEHDQLKDIKLSVLRELRNLEINLFDVTKITEAWQHHQLKKMLSKREESRSVYQNANRMDLFNIENGEYEYICCLISDLEAYLPRELTGDEIRKVIKGIHPLTMKDIMGAFKTVNADKSLVARIAKEFLN